MSPHNFTLVTKTDAGIKHQKSAARQTLLYSAKGMTVTTMSGYEQSNLSLGSLDSKTTWI